MEPATNRFTDKDAEKLVGLLNFVATNATFDKLKVKDIIAFNRMLSWAQTELLIKVQANVFEIQEVRQAVPAKKASK
jgi:hypothetical protein